MAQPTPEQMMMVAAQAAQAVTAAAKAIQDMQKPSGQRFGEASKVVKMPDAFGTEDHEKDQRTWRDFFLNFKSWLFYGDSQFEKEVKYIEDHPKETALLTNMTEEQKGRARQLYSILTGLLKGKPLRVLRQVSDRNGYEVLRQLVDLYTLLVQEPGRLRCCRRFSTFLRL